MALNQDFQLVNLGGGTYGAYNPTTNQARSFSSETEARTFFDQPQIDYSKAIAPSFDAAGLLGPNADKLINVGGSQKFGVNIPTTVPGSSVGTPGIDLSQQLNDYFSKQDEALKNLTTFLTPSQQETDTQNEINDLTNTYRSDVTDIKNKPIPLEFQTGQIQHATFVANDKLQALSSVLGSTTASRQQKLDVAKTIYDATRNSLQDTLNIYQATAPKSLGVTVDDSGQIIATMQNPITGTVYTQVAGQTTPKANVEFSQIGTDQYGQPTYGFVDKTTKTITPVGGSSQPTPGSPTPSNPAPGITTAANLLGSWVSGNPNQEPGYASAVYAALGINATTPVTSLQSRIPELASAIATAEGWGKANNVGTRINNPGNILFAGQPGATPYKAPNGHTYAAFATADEGWRAMYDLLGQKIGTGTDSAANQPYFGLNPKAYAAGAAVADDFRNEQIVKDFNSVENKAQSVQQIISKGVGGPGDLALVYDFMKALDPTSVVRESEYAAAASSGNIFMGALAKFNGYFKESGGFLPAAVKQSFQSILQTKLDVARTQYDNVATEYARRIDGVVGKQGVGKLFLTDYAKPYTFTDSEGILPLIDQATKTVDPAGIIYGGGPSLDINKALSGGGLSIG